jgi:hypothetical protein
MKDMWLDEIMDKVYETKKEMDMQVEQHTMTCL